MRELEILEELRDQSLSPTAEELVDELEKLIRKDVLWPLPVREAAESVFGGGVHNPKGKVHGSIDRRVRHALRVWRGRYEMNPAQMVYAGDVLARAILRGGADAATAEKKYPFVLGNLEKAVNHEVVHEGMKARAALVDVTDQLVGMYGGRDK